MIMKFAYPAIFILDENGRYKVVFPDLEGCAAEGDNFEEALERAKEAEEAWIRVELEDSWELPGISHEADLELPEGGFINTVAVRIKLVDDYD
ncbi:UNVERIFIED_ORG: toxin-antitoxin system, antitoxin component, HicB family protein [Lacrimispora saccharolytica]|nr:type II toxin-antitoxin system HicB family antitoxin [Clostridium sp.]